LYSYRRRTANDSSFPTAAIMARDDNAPPANTIDTALYIAGLAKELREMAKKADLGFLAYLLAMVEEDATDTARRLGKT
jgi:hypothetical protein